MTATTANPLVSVIIPAYNSEKYIEESVQSILDQTYQNMEIIIIDDASTDTTPTLIQQIQKQDSRIKVVKNPKNKGVGGTRTAGIKEARGGYVAWQDADDVSLPDRIERQVAYLIAHPEVGMVGGPIIFFDEDGDKTMRSYHEHDDELRRTIFRYNPIAQPASMFKKEVYQTVGSYDENLTVSEDLEMLLRAGEKYKFANLTEPVLRYRQSATSLTASKLRQMELVTLALRRKYRKSSAYTYTFMDSIFNAAQRVSMYMPTKLRMKLFQLIRGDKS